MLDYATATYDDVSAEIERLLVIKSEDLDMEALKNQQIFIEIDRIYTRFCTKLGKLTTQKAKVEHQRWRHYAGKMPAEHYKKEPLHEAVLKGDIGHMMNIDDIVIEIRSHVADAERIVKFLEDSKGQVKSRGFDIKNAIAWRGMMMGV